MPDVVTVTVTQAVTKSVEVGSVDAAHRAQALIHEQLAVERLVEFVVTTPVVSIDFQGIPQTFRDLLLVLRARTTHESTVGTAWAKLNNDGTTGNYRQQVLRATSSTVSANTASQSQLRLGETPAALTTPAEEMSQSSLLFAHYTSTTRHKSWTGQMAGVQGTLLEVLAGFWRGTAAIDRITVFPNAASWAAETHARLYGLGRL